MDNEVVPPPIEFIENGMRDLGTGNDGGQDAVIVGTLTKASNVDEKLKMNRIMKISKTEESVLPSAEGQEQKGEAVEGEDSSSTKQAGRLTFFLSK